jgi:predicted nuclease of predicted toxin-antitoxin system
MRLYLDDDSVDPGLIRLLRRDGHDVEVPADVGLAGSSDQVHLAHAIRHRRVIVTRNYRDFEALHDLVAVAGNGHHCGIVVVRFDNHPLTACLQETSHAPCVTSRMQPSPSPIRISS